MTTSAPASFDTAAAMSKPKFNVGDLVFGTMSMGEGCVDTFYGRVTSVLKQKSGISYAVDYYTVVSTINGKFFSRSDIRTLAGEDLGAKGVVSGIIQETGLVPFNSGTHTMQLENMENTLSRDPNAQKKSMRRLAYEMRQGGYF